MQPYVFRTRPHLVEKVWGGRKLANRFGKELPAEGRYGESWEVADLPEGQSLCDSGIYRGHTLRQLVSIWGAGLVGTKAPTAQFPLLVKLLDASDDLSVQVHPGEEDLEHFDEAHSKDESWVILDVDEGGSILHGFAEGATPEGFMAAVEEGRAVELLRRVKVQQGDVVRVAPGTVHAICKGVALLEVQEPSDTTFRVWDYERPGLDGKPRELHLEEAMKVACFTQPALDEGHEAAPVAGRPEVLVDCEAYRLERFRPAGPTSWAVDPAGPQVLHVLAGRIGLESQEGELLELSRGQTAIVPAAVNRVELREAAEADLVVAGLGGVRLVALD